VSPHSEISNSSSSAPHKPGPSLLLPQVLQHRVQGTRKPKSSHFRVSRGKSSAGPATDRPGLTTHRRFWLACPLTARSPTLPPPLRTSPARLFSFRKSCNSAWKSSNKSDAIRKNGSRSTSSSRVPLGLPSVAVLGVAGLSTHIGSKAAIQSCVSLLSYSLASCSLDMTLISRLCRIRTGGEYERRLTHDCIAALLPMCVEEQQQIGRYPQERLEIDVFLPRCLRVPSQRDLQLFLLRSAQARPVSSPSASPATPSCIAALLPMCVEEQQQIGRYPQERLEIDVFLPRSAWILQP
jgi:hypothetical protein